MIHLRIVSYEPEIADSSNPSSDSGVKPSRDHFISATKIVNQSLIVSVHGGFPSDTEILLGTEGEELSGVLVFPVDRLSERDMAVVERHVAANQIHKGLPPTAHVSAAIRRQEIDGKDCVIESITIKSLKREEVPHVDDPKPAENIQPLSDPIAGDSEAYADGPLRALDEAEELARGRDQRTTPEDGPIGISVLAEPDTEE